MIRAAAEFATILGFFVTVALWLVVLEPAYDIPPDAGVHCADCKQ